MVFCVKMMVGQMVFLFLRLRGASLLTRALRAAYAPIADPPSLFAPSGQMNKKPDHGFSTKKLSSHETFKGLASLTLWFHFY